jgi:proteic killer suppression protein
LDTFTLTLGDTLSREIDSGLVECDFGIVLLSPRFFAKSWPRTALDALVAREVNEQKKRIVPLWHDVAAEDVARYSPILASRLGVSTTAGLEVVVGEIERAAQVERPTVLESLDSAEALIDLRSPPGNRLEALKGDWLGQHSIRVNDQYRVCFVWTDAGPADVEILDYH